MKSLAPTWLMAWALGAVVVSIVIRWYRADYELFTAIPGNGIMYPYLLMTKQHKQQQAHQKRNLTVVVTGANSGVGFATIEHILRAPGMAKTVVMACRNMSNCQTAKDNLLNDLHSRDNIIISTTLLLPLQLDLANTTSIQSFVKRLHEKLLSLEHPQQHKQNEELASESGLADVPPIHLLINNAAVFAHSATPQYVDGIEEHIMVNHLGHVLLTHLLWPNIRAGRGRIVTVSSILALFPLKPTLRWYRDEATAEGDNRWLRIVLSFDLFGIVSYWDRIWKGISPYIRTKRANLMFAYELHRRYHKCESSTIIRDCNTTTMSAVCSIASHPGYSRTHIWHKSRKVLSSLLATFLQYNPLGSMSPEQASLSQVWAAFDPQQVPSGWYVGPQFWFCGKPVLLGPLVGDENDSPHITMSNFHRWPFTEAESESLWNQSLKVLGITEFGKLIV